MRHETHPADTSYREAEVEALRREVQRLREELAAVMELIERADQYALEESAR